LSGIQKKYYSHWIKANGSQLKLKKMKHKNLKLSTMKKIVLLLLIVIPLFSLAQEKVTWDYPVKPGSEEWKSKVKNNADRIRLCQVPTTVLTNLSTKELTKVVLDYPLFRTITAFGSLQNGFNIIRKQFGGFNELYKREDGAHEIIQVYNKLDPGRIELDWGNIEKGDWRFFIFDTEILLSQNEILSKLSDKELKILLKESINKFNSKIEVGYSLYVAHTSLLLAGRIMDKLEHPDFISAKRKNENIGFFLEAGIFSDKETSVIIQQLALNI